MALHCAMLALSWACGVVVMAGGDKLHLLRAPQHGFPASFGAQVRRESCSSTLPEDLTWKSWSRSSRGIRSASAWHNQREGNDSMNSCYRSHTLQFHKKPCNLTVPERGTTCSDWGLRYARHGVRRVFVLIQPCNCLPGSQQFRQQTESFGPPERNTA